MSSMLNPIATQREVDLLREELQTSKFLHRYLKESLASIDEQLRICPVNEVQIYQGAARTIATLLEL
jgi:hypothetical protein